MRSRISILALMPATMKQRFEMGVLESERRSKRNKSHSMRKRLKTKSGRLLHALTRLSKTRP